MFSVRSFCLPKDVRAADQNADAFEVDAPRGVAAIADGVASMIFSASWAKLLTQAAVHDTPNPRDGQALGQWLARQRRAWLAPIDPARLAWHQKPKFAEGAAATLLWLKAIGVQEPGGRPPRSFRFYAYARGDCCLFHISGGEVLSAFPFSDSRQFDEKPQVLRSVDPANAPPTTFDTLEDGCDAGDFLILCTDALAQWAILELEAGRSPGLESFWDMTEEAWRARIAELREARQIRFDDTTLVLLRMGG